MTYQELYEKAINKVDEEEIERAVEKIACLIRKIRNREVFAEHVNKDKKLFQSDLVDLLTREIGPVPIQPDGSLLVRKI